MFVQKPREFVSVKSGQSRRSVSKKDDVVSGGGVKAGVFSGFPVWIFLFHVGVSVGLVSFFLGLGLAVSWRVPFLFVGCFVLSFLVFEEFPALWGRLRAVG